MTGREADALKWLSVITRGTSDQEIAEVVNAINAASGSGQVSTGALIVACAQVLSQIIVNADPEIRPEVRAGIMATIDACWRMFAANATH